MARMYQMLAGDGVPHAPHVVRAKAGDRVNPIDLTPEQLDGLRRAMINVVEAGTARASRVAALTIAGKTATSQNPHGADHGWFIGFAPAESPRIVVAAVIEFAEHGSLVAPMVTRIIARYLGADSVAVGVLRLPEDSAPAAMPLPGFPASIDPRDTTPPRPR